MEEDEKLCLIVETVPNLEMCYFSSRKRERERERERSKIELLCGIICFSKCFRRVENLLQNSLAGWFVFQKHRCNSFRFQLPISYFWALSVAFITRFDDKSTALNGFQDEQTFIKRQPNSHVLRSGVLFLFRGALLYQSPHTEVTNLHSSWISCADIHSNFLLVFFQHYWFNSPSSSDCWGWKEK